MLMLLMAMVFYTFHLLHALVVAETTLSLLMMALLLYNFRVI